MNGVKQVVATTPGASYSLAFAFAARPGTTAAQNQMEIRFDGLVVKLAGELAKISPMGPQTRSFFVTGGSEAVETARFFEFLRDELARTVEDVLVRRIPLCLRGRNQETRYTQSFCMSWTHN